ncbi:hypothetical protein DSC47_04170 [Elizabethkingia miricola]|uniref:Uncharacterized protein n=1 Tax=Elizabethkingia bruuniana TaxID=1756149 RepID=A0A7T7UYQ2_9FLAO|nr:hypothetical protein [Elizabethkingia bruuniana]KGO09505.1 hypothetical protein KS04_13540 [Elizabethkingia miricola]AQX85173.1 hypothetical protein AYC65_09215 [Elizabethkingia bruuniana]KUY28640.1 hypothetical protein ATB97_00455 [Elizabethkingia bruuniana]OPB70269.1 hypothetical protein BAY12_16565 [Elizabethkingia bruuniana]OPC54085.1 hypothetical protein BAY07_09735 [Elizabethkingia bruuniana]
MKLEEFENFIILDETPELLLGNIYEAIYLVNKNNNEFTFIDEMYGDPYCGIICTDNNYCIIGGHYLFLWVDGESIRFEDLKDIYDIRKASDNEYEILTDPWSENSSIWIFNVMNKSFIKLRDFDKYRNTEYTNDVIW